MNRINPKQAIALICVLLAIVVVIHNEQNRRERQKEATIAEQQRKTEETVAAQKAAQKQQELQKQQEAAAQKAAEDAANAHAEFLARFTNTNFTRNPGIETVAVAVADESGTMNHTVGAALVNRFKSERLNLTDAFFKPALVSGGLFNDAFNGSNDLFNKLELAKYLDALLLARQDIQYSTNATLGNIVTANMHLEIVALPVAGQIQNQAWKFMATGAGTGPTEAREQAEQRTIKQISTDTNMSLVQIGQNH